MKDFGARLLRMRLERHLTQEALGALIGSSGAYIAHLETGRRQPGRVTLLRLADAFDTTLDALLNAGGTRSLAAERTTGQIAELTGAAPSSAA